LRPIETAVENRVSGLLFQPDRCVRQATATSASFQKFSDYLV
jgi:hypothetical protein